VVRTHGHIGVEEPVDRLPVGGLCRVGADALLTPANAAQIVVLAPARGVVVVARIGVVETIDRRARGLGRVPSNPLLLPANPRQAVVLIEKRCSPEYGL
jgi:hypothetical protein